MTARLCATLLGVTVGLAACSNGGTASYESAALDTNDQKASYGIGINVGTQIADTRDRLDRAAFMRGIEDALQTNEPAISRQELQTVLQTFGQEIEAEAAEARGRQAGDNAAAGEAYQAENAARAGVITTESGLQYEVVAQGEGATPTRENQVRLHYRGTLVDGTEFDSSYDGDPVVFPAGGLIPGFTEALLLMKEGSHFRVVIPSDIAYGPNGSGGTIGPNATLIFEIELFEVVQ
ncbi:MAG: FKBP-type peptidyl-prolyl cis-trans isomerase [Gemmatimonadetes bacterium]|nr:FKBP-type peptidyl-prolyl cis-trans isomerase [Gemmatimonadota bacterium]MDA1102338.1 FKBP-type peptidyl-prolyl cis-trans isomerase [Gemmatimonadota bacterium]